MRNYKCIAYEEIKKDKKNLKIKRILQVAAILGMAIAIGMNA